MGDQPIEQSYNQATSISSVAYAQASALQIRLSVTEIIENIEAFLTGTKTIVYRDPKTGQPVVKKETTKNRIATEDGIRKILNYVSAIVNPQVVQGNFPSDGAHHSTIYEGYIYEVHTELAVFLVNNQINWCIRDADLDVIIDFIMKLVIPFMTRLIDNKERESYETTLKHVENINSPKVQV
jgi:hypothetical protein